MGFHVMAGGLGCLVGARAMAQAVNDPGEGALVPLAQDEGVAVLVAARVSAGGHAKGQWAAAQAHGVLAPALRVECVAALEARSNA